MKKEIQNREKRRKTIKIFMNHYGEEAFFRERVLPALIKKEEAGERG